ncbi:MAG: nucleotidyltransferase family protein [Parvularculaceae bacterium]|nr:nucleotidyltransferase family protein [Parvularculaceae bacterium]
MSAQGSKFAAILLAAGRAQRFGGDKLDAVIDGCKVIERAARALAASSCGERISVVSAANRTHDDLLLSCGFSVVVNPDAPSGMASSIRAGVEMARQRGCSGVLIALADMPFVATPHFNRLFAIGEAHAAGLSFSAAGDKRMAPAFFRDCWFGDLAALRGDEGARGILARAPTSAGVRAAPAMLRDIDLPQDLAAPASGPDDADRSPGAGQQAISQGNRNAIFG